MIIFQFVNYAYNININYEHVNVKIHRGDEYDKNNNRFNCYYACKYIIRG